MYYGIALRATMNQQRGYEILVLQSKAPCVHAAGGKQGSLGQSNTLLFDSWTDQAESITGDRSTFHDLMSCARGQR